MRSAALRYKDFVTAKKLSWLTVQIDRQDGEYSKTPAAPGYEADRTILSLTELKSILRSIHEICVKLYTIGSQKLHKTPKLFKISVKRTELVTV